MEDVTGWFASSIRQGVLRNGGYMLLTDRFRNWIVNRSGRVVLQEQSKTDDVSTSTWADSNIMLFDVVCHSKPMVYFEKQEDLVFARKPARACSADG